MTENLTKTEDGFSPAADLNFISHVLNFCKSPEIGKKLTDMAAASGQVPVGVLQQLIGDPLHRLLPRHKKCLYTDTPPMLLHNSPYLIKVCYRDTGSQLF